MEGFYPDAPGNWCYSIFLIKSMILQEFHPLYYYLDWIIDLLWQRTIVYFFFALENCPVSAGSELNWINDMQAHGYFFKYWCPFKISVPHAICHLYLAVQIYYQLWQWPIIQHCSSELTQLVWRQPIMDRKDPLGLREGMAKHNIWQLELESN